jgi:hypothetical protein
MKIKITPNKQSRYKSSLPVHFQIVGGVKDTKSVQKQVSPSASSSQQSDINSKTPN